MVGQIVNIKREDGQDAYADILWRWEKDDGSIQVVHKQHLLKHLQKIRVVEA